jgi:hypothetical protein
LVYGPIPSAYTAALGTGNAFLSTASFVDSIGETYQWYFFCSTLVYGIRRIYAHSVFGNPFLDSIRYCWPLSSTDNTCTPTWALRKGNNINGCGTGTTQTAVYVDPGP